MKTKNLMMIIVVLCSFLFLSACSTNSASGEKIPDNTASVNKVQSGNGQETQTNEDDLVPPAFPN